MNQYWACNIMDSWEMEKKCMKMKEHYYKFEVLIRGLMITGLSIPPTCQNITVDKWLHDKSQISHCSGQKSLDIQLCRKWVGLITKIVNVLFKQQPVVEITDPQYVAPWFWKRDSIQRHWICAQKSPYLIFHNYCTSLHSCYIWLGSPVFCKIVQIQTE